MFLINNLAFSYLLYPKKVDSLECSGGMFANDVDRLYYYFLEQFKFTGKLNRK